MTKQQREAFSSSNSLSPRYRRTTVRRYLIVCGLTTSRPYFLSDRTVKAKLTHLAASRACIACLRGSPPPLGPQRGRLSICLWSSPPGRSSRPWLNTRQTRIWKLVPLTCSEMGRIGAFAQPNILLITVCVHDSSFYRRAWNHLCCNSVSGSPTSQLPISFGGVRQPSVTKQANSGTSSL